MIDITLDNFETEVVAASLQTPVLVDFWATWCGPCKVIGPLLEKLEVAYEGRFKLAKIDSDQQQELAQAFGIRSIPTCVLMIDGKPVDGFMGALPEGQIKAFLDKHLPSQAELEAEAETEDALALAAAGDPSAALHKLADALALDPGNDDTRYDYTKLLLQLGELDEASAILEPKLKEIPRKLRFEALGHYLDALRYATTQPHCQWSVEQLDAAIAQNKRDFEARYAKACQFLAQGQWAQAMDELLEIIMRDKTWNQEAARKTFVAILELLTPPKPRSDAPTPGKTAGGIELMGKSATVEDPQAQLVSSYRRKLSMALN